MRHKIILEHNEEWEIYLMIDNHTPTLLEANPLGLPYIAVIKPYGKPTHWKQLHVNQEMLEATGWEGQLARTLKANYPL